MIDQSTFLSAALGVLVANFLLFFGAALIVAYEFRQYTKAIRGNTEAMRDHTKVYIESVGKALRHAQEVKQTASEGASHVADTAREAAGETKQQAAESAQHVRS